MVYKYISETGCDKGTWMELVQNFYQRRQSVCVVHC